MVALFFRVQLAPNGTYAKRLLSLVPEGFTFPPSRLCVSPTSQLTPRSTESVATVDLVLAVETLHLHINPTRRHFGYG